MAANIKVKARQTTSESWESEGNDVYVKSLRDGSISVADFRLAAIAAGRGFHATFGSFSGGTVQTDAAFDVDEPAVVIQIPSGTSVLPISIRAQSQTGAPVDGQETEILFAVDQDSSGAVVSATNFTATSIYNMNTLFGRASACSAWSDATDSMTDPVLDIELARSVIEYDVAANGQVAVVNNLIYEPKTPLIVNGPAMIVGYWGGDTAVVGGFAQVEWIEFPSKNFA